MSNPSADSCVNILGVKVHATSMDRALARLQTAVAQNEKGYVCVTGVQGVMEAQVDSNLKRIINGALLTIPDGRPTVWVGWLRGHLDMRQVTGPTMMLQICELSPKNGYKHFFYGGNDGVADQLKEALTQQYPGLNVVGTYTPPFRPLTAEEEADLVRHVSETQPDFFWVGLSTPKQERFMDQYGSKLDAKIMLGVGAAFDMHTGRIKDAPYWMKFTGLQWIHRIWQDPKRLWKRYLVNNPKFVYQITLELLGIRKQQEV
ncbi:MAG TPA: WecB/TagA/CpsF family glycosyltransferase [Candidatus Sulfotelmatobacter sp.]|jgi:N-acetylglucosaminyldiphosphoundecaprenol N-acetyl-beta-D-mannosaminyltransferase